MTSLHARLFNAAILSIVCLFSHTFCAFAQAPVQVLPRQPSAQEPRPGREPSLRAHLEEVCWT